MCERADRPTARAGVGWTGSVVRRVRLAMESAAPSPQRQYQLDFRSSREAEPRFSCRQTLRKTPASDRSSDAAPSTMHTRASTKAGVATLFTRDVVFASMNEGLLSTPLCFGGMERVCERWSPAGMDAGGAPAGWGCGRALGSAGGVAGRSGAHVSIASSTVEDRVLSGLAPVAHVKNGLSGSQAKNGSPHGLGVNGRLMVTPPAQR
jgi:hypothetical protein